MNRSSTNKGFPTKKEGDDDDCNNPKGPSSSRPWSGLKDPRIVRVSRTFGGKDRHSKVCTIRGLRDRRVRLSVPTALQLYDLQDRLGLNQPSKVVDWLLSAAQDDIDKLPPLQMHPEQFLQYPQPVLVSHEATPLSISVVGAKSDVYERSSGADLLSSKGNAKGSNDEFREDEMAFPKSTYWNSDAPSRAKCKEVRGEMTSVNARSNWMKKNEHQNQDGSHQDHHGAPQVLPVHNSFPRPNLSSIPNLLNNAIPYTPYYHWDLPSNSSVPHLSGHGYPSQIEEAHNFNSISMPPSLSLPSGSQLLLYPSGTTPSIFPQYVSTPAEGDPRQISHFQLLSSASQNLLANPITSLYSINPTMRPFQVNITPMYHDFQNSHGSQQNALHETSTATTSAVTTSSLQNDSKDATLGSNPSSFI